MQDHDQRQHQGDSPHEPGRERVGLIGGELDPMRVVAGRPRRRIAVERRRDGHPVLGVGPCIMALHGLILPDNGHRPPCDVSSIHLSVRLPSYVLAVETIFGLPDERLTIRHDAGSGAEPHVGGTLLAAQRVMDMTGLVRGLDRLLVEP